MAENIKINETELEEVSGGAGGWQKYARGRISRCPACRKASRC